MPRIPDDYHFIFGLQPGGGGRPFSLIHYLSVVSCHRVNGPRSMRFYYTYEPTGEWWERAKPYLTLVKVEPPREIFGNPVRHYAHMADVLRLQILLEHGGIYLDMDIISLRPFAPLQDSSTVLGEEMGMGLCNAVILAEPGAPFLRRWLDAYRSFDADDWNGHSVRLPRALATEMPSAIRVVGPKQFFWPMYWKQDLEAFFLRPGSRFCDESYCVHVWESITWDSLRGLTPAHINAIDSEFCRLVRPFLNECVQPCTP